MLRSFLIPGSQVLSLFLPLPLPPTVPSPPFPSLPFLLHPPPHSPHQAPSLGIPKGIREPRLELPLSALPEGKTVFSFSSSLYHHFPGEVAEKGTR